VLSALRSDAAGVALVDAGEAMPPWAGDIDCEQPVRNTAATAAAPKVLRTLRFIIVSFVS
jgi:hypothetical protein